MITIWNILISKFSWLFPLSGSGTIIPLKHYMSVRYIITRRPFIIKRSKGTNEKYRYTLHRLLYKKCDVFINIHRTCINYDIKLYMNLKISIDFNWILIWFWVGGGLVFFFLWGGGCFVFEGGGVFIYFRFVLVFLFLLQISIDKS